MSLSSSTVPRYDPLPDDLLLEGCAVLLGLHEPFWADESSTAL